MKIREFDLDDLQEVITLSKAAYDWKGEEVRERARDFVNYTLEKYTSEAEGLFVAEEKGKIIGNCFGHIDDCFLLEVLSSCPESKGVDR